jgi:hypothetical protein
VIMLGVHALIGCSGTASTGPLIALLIIPSTLSAHGCLIVAGARSRLPWPRRRRERRALPLRRVDLLRSGDLDLARWHLTHVPRAHPIALGVGMRHAAAALPAAAAALGAAALTAPLGAAVAPLNATLPAADQYDQYDDRA